MYCQNCGTQMNKNDTYCFHCGAFNKKNEDYSDEELLVAYIGKNHEKIKNNGFSFSSFFLGVYYFLYRKMYLLAFLWLVTSVFLTLMLGAFSFFFIVLALILLSCNFNSIYLDKAKNDIEKIKQKYPGMDKEKLKKICRQKGGTDIIVPFVVSIFSFLLVLLISFLVFYSVEVLPENYPNHQTPSNPYDPTTTLILGKKIY